SDAGAEAPAGAKLPKGIDGVKVVRLADPTNPAAPVGYVYVMRSGAGGPTPAYTKRNGYVQYDRDANADLFAFSESSYEGYGAARSGFYCDAEGNVVRDANGKPKIGQRRPRDGAT